MNKLLVILGSTATGKTDLGIYMAKKFNGEIVSVDSRQVYIGLDIGSGKFPGQSIKVKKGRKYWEMDGIKVWLYDVIFPTAQYSVSDYVKDATEIILEIESRNKLPILVGGTGWYLRALLEGLSNLAIPVNQRLRKELEKNSLLSLQEKLQSLSFAKWQQMNDSDRQNSRRLIRAIELFYMDPYKNTKKKFIGLNKNHNIFKIGLSAPRKVLYKKVDLRVLSRLNQGLVEESIKLHKNGLTIQRMKQLGLECGVLADYLESKISLEQLPALLQIKIHGFVRRQLTWFKKEEKVNWFDITDKDYIERLEKIVHKWYYSPDAS